MKTIVAGGFAAVLLAGALLTVGSSGASTPKVTCRAPASARLDLIEPSFSHPTEITNPLFPAGTTGQSILLGAEAGEKLRFEVTELPETRVFRWKGHDIATRVSVFVGYLEGRILEVAVDHFAQDDAGNVWYFGEDV